MNPTDLIDILSWARPHDSKCERDFDREWLGDIPADAFGNRILKIGPAPNILWSCHIDTVAARDGWQDVKLAGDTVSLLYPKPGRSLGADDGVGLWLMLDMIEHGISGLYIFHRGEEQGCLGSRHIATQTPEILDGIDAAIAFDRAGTQDIITHQLGQRTASDAFAYSIAAQLPPGFRPDDTGVYTDTNEYADLVPECTNLSVGYYDQHGPRETLDLAHAMRMRDACRNFDTSKFIIARDPTPTYYSWTHHLDRDPDTGPDEGLASLCYEHPEIAANLLAAKGVTWDEFAELAWTTQ